MPTKRRWHPRTEKIGIQSQDERSKRFKEWNDETRRRCGPGHAATSHARHGQRDARAANPPTVVLVDLREKQAPGWIHVASAMFIGWWVAGTSWMDSRNEAVVIGSHLDDMPSVGVPGCGACFFAILCHSAAYAGPFVFLRLGGGGGVAYSGPLVRPCPGHHRPEIDADELQVKDPARHRALAVSTVSASAETIMVCANGWDYISIHAALGAADNADANQLSAETYFEGEPIDTPGTVIMLHAIWTRCVRPRVSLTAIAQSRGRFSRMARRVRR